MARRLLIVVGLKREARLAGRGGGATLCSGGDVGLLEQRLARIDPGEFSGVVSFGLAGGLDPDLSPGDLLLARSVAAPARSYGADAALTDALAGAVKAAGLRLSDGVFAGVDDVVLTPEDKAALRRRTGAATVDMESHVAARFAAACGLPFAALRAVSDPASRALPKLAAQALTLAGGVDYGRVIAGLARAPRELGALLEAGRDSAAAFATLKRAGRAFAFL
ncbi:MAG TPA: phosphorylase [Rhodoblastus sp.]|nr:phosphorylase [Rhodoblastus sp.]